MMYICAWHAPELRAAAVDLLEDDRRFGEPEAGAAVFRGNERRQPAGVWSARRRTPRDTAARVELLPVRAGKVRAEGANGLLGCLRTTRAPREIRVGGRPLRRRPKFRPDSSNMARRDGARDTRWSCWRGVTGRESEWLRGAMVGVEFVQVDHDWKSWIGRTQTSADWITPSRVAAWHATLDHSAEAPKEGDAAPLGISLDARAGSGARVAARDRTATRDAERFSPAGDVAAPVVGREPRDVSPSAAHRRARRARVGDPVGRGEEGAGVGARVRDGASSIQHGRWRRHRGGAGSRVS